VEADGFPHLHSFTAGLKRDHAAVINGLTMEHNSGAVEGAVSHLTLWIWFVNLFLFALVNCDEVTGSRLLERRSRAAWHRLAWERRPACPEGDRGRPGPRRSPLFVVGNGNAGEHPLSVFHPAVTS
jgi:hypothetical protein